MKVFIAIMGLVLFTGMAWSFGEFYGTVYKGPGTGEPSSFALVRARLGDTDETRGCNQRGQYSIQYLPAPGTYYLYAWKYYGEEKWTDSKYSYLPDNDRVREDFHLHRGEDPEK